LEESYAPSSASKSNIQRSDNLKESSVGKASRSKSNRTDKIEEKDNESENSLERDETYSEDFAS
jgi:hypothetical protein